MGAMVRRSRRAPVQACLRRFCRRPRRARSERWRSGIASAPATSATAIEIPPFERSESDNTNKEWIARFEAETMMPYDFAPAQPSAAAAERAHVSAGRFTHRRHPHAVLRVRRSLRPSHQSFAARGPSFGGVCRHYSLTATLQSNRPAKPRAIRKCARIGAAVGRRPLGIGRARRRRRARDLRRAAAARSRTAPRRAFADAPPGSYEIVNADIFSALARFEPNSFDLIMCVRFFERFDPQQMFREWQHLQPPFIIVDTNVAPGRGPVLRFTLQMPEIAGGSVARRSNISSNIISISLRGPDRVLVRLLWLSLPSR